MLTLIIPVFRNEHSIQELVETIASLAKTIPEEFEAVFVDDGSPDRSRESLVRLLPGAGFRGRIVSLSRNYGSFAAVRAGLSAGNGDFFAVMAADLQEPPSLVAEFFTLLRSGSYDVVVGTRDQRADAVFSRLSSALFWRLYRWLVRRDVPAGGVDVFGCNRAFRDRILELSESNSTLVGLIFWLGFRRAEVQYSRLPRRHGSSGWSFGR